MALGFRPLGILLLGRQCYRKRRKADLSSTRLTSGTIDILLNLYKLQPLIHKMESLAALNLLLVHPLPCLFEKQCLIPDAVRTKERRKDNAPINEKIFNLEPPVKLSGVRWDGTYPCYSFLFGKKKKKKKPHRQPMDNGLLKKCCLPG